jgi:hypothetical protein
MKAIKRLLFLTVLVSNLVHLAHSFERQDLLYERQFNPEIFQNLFDENEIMEDPLVQKLSEKQSILELLTRVKFAIISGNFERAKTELIKMRNPISFGKILRDRYMAIIYFLEGNFDKSLTLLALNHFQVAGRYEKICRLKILNMLILDRITSLENEWGKCRSLTSNHERNEGAWLDNMVKLKLNLNNYVLNNKIRNLEGLGYNEESVIMYMKMALYMNLEHIVIPMIAGLPISFFENDAIRELMGHLYYRNGEFATSYDFIEDLEGPNAENIKGNIYLTQNQYELAYAQYKLALNKKVDSTNALERALPLAWLLRQPLDGIDYVSRLYVNEPKNPKKLAILSAFQIQTGEIEKANENLELLTYNNRYSQPHEVNQLFAYTSLLQNKREKAKTYSDLSCKKLDGLNCWLLMQINQWEDFGLTIKRAENLPDTPEKELQQLLSQRIKKPIEEDVFIDQRDIEELDDQMIQLKPN